MPPATDRDDFTAREYESLLRQGIAYVKGGNREQARRLLLRAAGLIPTESQPWVWLSAATSDPQEQYDYLSRAVGIDPSNSAARRGLALLTGKLKKDELRPEGASVPPPPAQPADETESRSFRCQKCGGSLVFSVQAQSLVCENCRTPVEIAKVRAADQAEQDMDPALMGERAHRWARNLQRITCGQCGSVILRGEGRQSDRCPYCASNRLVLSEDSAELITPHVIIPMAVDQKDALRMARDWLKSGWLTPESLVKQAGKLRLAPAYYPFWTFDGTVQVTWRCEVNEGTSRNPRWVARSGEEMQFFDDVLTTGIKAMPPKELAALEPFRLKEALAFAPDFIAGWPALMYDIPMADASLRAREKVVRQLQQSLYSRIEPGREKRDIANGAGRWSGMTYKLVLLPLWVGVYQHKGKLHRLLVNGQTGKVGGSKPVDLVNLALLLVLGVLVVAVLAYLLILVLGRPG